MIRNLIWITKLLEQKITEFLWGLCSFFYSMLKPILFTVRTLLWPFRKKAPWKY